MVEIHSLDHIAAKITDFVASAENRQITGVRLGVQIRNEFPSFYPSAYYCKNLRQFISKNVPNVREAGQSGPDVIYGLVGDDVSQPTRWKVPPTAWRTFSNPNPRYNLHANLESFDVTTFPPGTQVGSPWVRIQSCSEALHMQIAKDFILTIPEPTRDLLQATLGEPKWWLSLSNKAREL